MFWSAVTLTSVNMIRMLNSDETLRLSRQTFFLVPSLAGATSACAQTPRQPEREQLLNGLRLLFWLKPGSPEVILKLRINSGAAFDLAGKSGQMALLGDLLFPDPATVDYFTDEMGGKLDVSVNYDSTTITMVGKAAELEQIVEVLRNAIAIDAVHARSRHAHARRAHQAPARHDFVTGSSC